MHRPAVPITKCSLAILDRTAITKLASAIDIGAAEIARLADDKAAARGVGQA